MHSGISEVYTDATALILCYIIAMELYQLRQLIAVAECGTLSKAAEMVHTSQPALSRSMQNLEAELGVPLFTRTKNSIALTETGMLAARHAQIVVSAHNDMIQVVKEADRRLCSFSFGSIAPAPIWEMTPIVSKAFAGKTIHTEESAPRFGMSGKAFHKRRITIFTCMRAPDVWINGIVRNGQIRFCYNAAYCNAFDDWIAGYLIKFHGYRFHQTSSLTYIIAHL